MNTNSTFDILEFLTQIQDVRADDATSRPQYRAVEASSLTTGDSSVFTINWIVYSQSCYAMKCVFYITEKGYTLFLLSGPGIPIRKELWRFWGTIDLVIKDTDIVLDLTTSEAFGVNLALFFPFISRYLSGVPIQDQKTSMIRCRTTKR